MSALEAHPSLERQDSRAASSSLWRDSLLFSSTTPYRPGKAESAEDFLARQTHLQLNGKGHAEIGSLRGLSKLRVLYLYDNKIERLSNLQTAFHLTHLYLQNNAIACISGLEACRKLEKLYLDGNRIARLEGLQECTRLQELHLSKQRGVEGLSFDPGTLIALSDSLRVLNVADSGVGELAPLGVLRLLETALLQNNTVADMEEVEMMLHGCRRLTNLDLRDNPVGRVPKFREQLIVWGRTLATLDARPIIANEREFLQRLQQHKQQRLLRGGAEGDGTGLSPEPSGAHLGGGGGGYGGGAPTHLAHPALPSGKGGFRGGPAARHGAGLAPSPTDGRHELPPMMMQMPLGGHGPPGGGRPALNLAALRTEEDDDMVNVTEMGPSPHLSPSGAGDAGSFRLEGQAGLSIASFKAPTSEGHAPLPGGWGGSRRTSGSQPAGGGARVPSK